MLGYELADIAENDDWFRLAYRDPVYRALVRREWAAHIDNAASTNSLVEPQERLVDCKNGERKVMEFHLRRVGDYYIYLHIDVSARYHLAAELRRLANTDTLTGVANRRKFFEMGTASVSLASGALAVLVFDLDQFKTVNDEYGHAVGDQVLVEVTVRCRAVLAAGQLLARLGGEEFGVLLPACDRGAAVDLAERLRAAIASTPMTIASAVLTATISVGGACGLSGETDNIDMLLVRADRALYAAKRAGRNQVCFD